MTIVRFDTDHIELGTDFDSRNRYLRTASISSVVYYMGTGALMRFGGGGYGGYLASWRWSCGGVTFNYEPTVATFPDGLSNPPVYVLQYAPTPPGVGTPVSL